MMLLISYYTYIYSMLNHFTNMGEGTLFRCFKNFSNFTPAPACHTHIFCFKNLPILLLQLLSILEDFLYNRNHKYMRLDGTTSSERRCGGVAVFH